MPAHQPDLWELPDAGTRTAAQRRGDWENEHVERDYASVFSVTEDPGLRAKLIGALGPMNPGQLVIVPGCGSRTLLERDLLGRLPVKVWSSDYPAVVDLARSRFEHRRLRWRARDSSRLRWRAVADGAVLVNSVVSDSHSENEAIIRSVANALRPGGRFVGLFPTPMDILEAAGVLRDDAMRSRVDLDRCAVRARDGGEQRYYGPLRLRRMLHRAGVEIERIEVVFLDSAHFRAQGDDPYRADEPDLVTWEYLIVGRRVT